MQAEIEQLDGSYIYVEKGTPDCGTYCDTCGDCLACSPHNEEDYCRTGGRWVIYLSDKPNPNYDEYMKQNPLLKDATDEFLKR
ncbi:hypothetical protein LCGC14_2777500 [marine sediment metagenome]|uniref:Uncharacterized protein n=1 Tax=marine sediment metagenome TaxID=412755 RepID=A0A0F9B324_9ZZZZ